MVTLIPVRPGTAAEPWRRRYRPPWVGGLSQKGLQEQEAVREPHGDALGPLPPLALNNMNVDRAFRFLSKAESKDVQVN
jgi:hypothetical protein